jgi:hypothetical protein
MVMIPALLDFNIGTVAELKIGPFSFFRQICPKWPKKTGLPKLNATATWISQCSLYFV